MIPAAVYARISSDREGDNLAIGRQLADCEELAKLRTAVVEGFKEFEFSLRRQLAGAEKDRPVLGGNEDVPQGYRDLVNEYFKSLSKKSPPPQKP